MEAGEIGDINFSGRDKPTTLEVVSKEEISSGSQLNKERWKANVISTGIKGNEIKREISLIRRTIEYPQEYRNAGETSAQYFVRIWQTMKNAGITVLPNVSAAGEEEVLETDLTADGSQIYGKDSRREDRFDEKIDPLFLNIDLVKVEEAAKDLSKKANTSNIQLSADHPLDLIVHPDGTWIVMARDVKNTTLNPLSQNIMINENEGAVERFVNHLTRTKERLLK